MEKKIEFKVGKDILRGSLFIPEGKGPFPSVIFFHGDKGRGDKYFETGSKFAKKGFLTLAFNYRGHGRSDGELSKLTLKDSFNDARKAINFLLSQKACDVNRFGIFGGSYGGFVASVIVNEFQIKSLILAMPSARGEGFSSKIDRGNIKNMDYYLHKTNWRKSKSYNEITKYKGNLLVIRVERDENIPSEVVNEYFHISESKNKKIIVLKDIDHDVSTPEMRDRLFQKAIEWFSETL